MNARETILVTGGAGAIGSGLVADLCRDIQNSGTRRFVVGLVR